MKDSEFFILVVDDQIDICELIQETIEEDLDGIKVLTAQTIEEAKQILSTQKIDLILLDIWLENQNDGIDFLTQIKKSNYDLSVIMISGHGNLSIAVKSIKIGAYDYIEKPFPADKLKNTVKNALDFQKFQRSQGPSCFSDIPLEIAGQSKFAIEMREFVKKFSKSQSRILIYGEPGCGKEFFARLIHKNSNNLNQSFRKIQASDEIVLKNLNLEELNLSGTVFFDKIDKFPLYFQKSLLNFINIIQFNLNNHISENKKQDQYPRIIISSSISPKSLENESRSGRFDFELFERINVLTIELASLKSRIKDLPEIIKIFSDFFYKTYALKEAKFSETAIAKLSIYDWPGNFCELKNFLELTLLQFQNSKNQNNDEISSEFINNSFFFNSPNSFSEFLVKIEEIIDLPLKEARDLFEKKYILMNLKKFEGSITKTAEFIGMDRSALHRKLKMLEIDCAF